MLIPVPFEGIKGKTVKELHVETEVVIMIFTDGTFTYRLYSVEYECISKDDCDNNTTLAQMIYILGDRRATALEIATKDEIQAYINERDGEQKKLQDERDRLQYERLKKKFEK